MTDRELTDALKGLGMDAASFRALPLLPLVQVAWADGSVQDAERALILQLAAERYQLDEEGQRMLRNWLHHPPSHGYVKRGHQVLLALCRYGASGDPRYGREGLADVIGFAKQVARAAGGFFGLGAVAAEEAEAIDAIAEALDIHHERPWIEPDDTTIIPADADTESEGPSPEVVFHPPAEPITSRGWLVLYDDLRGEQSCPVGPSGVTIGRNRENAVQITYDAQVSRQHCRLFERDGLFYVEDLGSTRGTWVNGERVLERRLLGGETLHLGHARFFFQLSPQDPS
jgi:hypothetical protein